MGIIRDFINWRATSKTNGNPQSPQYWVQKMFGVSGNTAAGIAVNESSALTSTAVWRAVSLVSQTIGSLPLHMYQRIDERSSNKAINHKLYYLLHSEPNPEQSAFEFKEMLQAHLLTWGRAHAEIAVDGKGNLQLWPLIPNRVKVLKGKDNKRPQYLIDLPDGGQTTLSEKQVFTLRGMGYSLHHSYNIITLFRESLGLTLAAEEFGARFFGNGATLGGFLEHPGQLGEEAHKELRESMENRHQGLENAHRFMILEEGMKYREVAVPPDKAQFLETRKFQIADVARIMGVPPHKLAEMDKATFSNIEHQAIEFVQDTINPWCVRWEQALSRQLLSDNEKQKYYFKHNLAGLLRGDFKTRMEGYSIGRQNGWLSANDVRELEDMNPIENGDIYLSPLNMAPSDKVKDEAKDDVKEVKPESDSKRRKERRAADSRQKTINAYKPLLQNAALEVLKRERADVMRKAKKLLGERNTQAFQEWLREFYDDHAEFVNKKMSPLFISLADLMYFSAAEEVDLPEEPTDRIKGFTGSYIDTYTKKHNNLSLAVLEEAIVKDDPVVTLEETFDNWETVRAAEIGNDEAVGAASAFLKMSFIVGGVSKLVWRANPGACEFCQSLDGKVVGIEESFVPAGGSVSSITGDNPPLTVSSNIKHPPVHDFCNCYIDRA